MIILFNQRQTLVVSCVFVNKPFLGVIYLMLSKVLTVAFKARLLIKESVKKSIVQRQVQR